MYFSKCGQIKHVFVIFLILNLLFFRYTGCEIRTPGTWFQKYFFTHWTSPCKFWWNKIFNTSNKCIFSSHLWFFWLMVPFCYCSRWLERLRFQRICLLVFFYVHTYSIWTLTHIRNSTVKKHQCLKTFYSIHCLWTRPSLRYQCLWPPASTEEFFLQDHGCTGSNTEWYNSLPPTILFC